MARALMTVKMVVPTLGNGDSEYASLRLNSLISDLKVSEFGHHYPGIVIYPPL